MKKKEKLKVMLPAEGYIKDRAAVLTTSPISPHGCSNPNPYAKETYVCTHTIVKMVAGGQTVYATQCTNDAKGSGGGLLSAPTYY
jgi:hypothetical protein